MQKILSPRDLYWEIALKFEIKQSKTCTVTHKFCICQRTITCDKWLQSEIVTVNCCLRRSPFTLGLDFLGLYRQRTCMAAFWKVYVLKPSFSKTFPQSTEYINFTYHYKLAQDSETQISLPSINLADFETQSSLRIWAPPKISSSKRAFEKYKPRGLFSEFYRPNLTFISLNVTTWRKKAVPSEISIGNKKYIFPTVKPALLVLFDIPT